jgi:transposase
MGRPTKYDPEFCERVVPFMADGYSTKALASELGVSLSTVYLWAEQHEEFSEALKAGQAAAARWWEDKLRTVAATGEGNASAAIFGVKNRSQEEWRDKVEQDHTSSDGSMSPTRIEIAAPSDDDSQG